MRLRYQLVVALLVITLMASCFLAGRQFQSLAASVPGGRAGASALLGAALGASESLDATGIEDVDIRPLEAFQEALSHLRRQYVTPIENEDDLTYGAIRGMLSALRKDPYQDRYTRFLDPEEYRSFLEENEGHFGGIGAEISVAEVEFSPELLEALPPGLVCPICGAFMQEPKSLQPVIIAPLPGSPAERAGLLAGDRIIRVDDVLTANLTLDEVVRRIKGPSGTTVKLLVTRAGELRPMDIEVTRAVIDVRSAEHKLLPDGIGYLRISTFNETTPGLVADALRELRTGGMRVLLLDLRNNAGGGLDVCVQVASQFLGEGPVVYIQERGQPREPRHATRSFERFDLPMAVLINLGTASAAEILAGALKDAEMATLVGAQTFGKGLVQTVIPLRDGSALAVTTARYFTPKLRDIERQGISPDVLVEQPKSETREYIPPLSEKDVQGAAALDLLRKVLRESDPTAV